MSTFKVYSPHDNSEIAELNQHTFIDVEKALSKAFGLYNDRPNWLKKSRRIEILTKTAELMKTKVEELTKKAAEEGGKPYQDSNVEVLRAISGIEAAVAELHNYGGQQIPMALNEKSEGRIAYTMKEPRGVVVSISAFNHPLNLIVHQVIPAIAVGAPVIVKPAPVTPLSCIALVEILYEAGLPKEWCQVLHLENNDAETLVTDSRVSFLSFIGSSKVGWMLRSKLAPGAHCVLEHGGAAPVIVRENADFDKMLPLLLKAGYYHAGQVCVSVQRVFAPKKIAKDLAQKIADGASKLKVGDPLDPETEVGPLIRSAEVDRIESWVNEAIEDGAELITGGKRINDFYYKPTVLLDPSDNSKVSKQEIFGPVVCVYSYDKLNEAILRANNVPWSFQASVFTKNIDEALESVQRLNAVAVMVNDHTAFRVDWMPFGGAKESGLGMGGIKYSMEDMSLEKLMVIKSDKLIY
jgi:acyl-CoA reductase-like NAD-dependent aldehyde dehydrogenase